MCRNILQLNRVSVDMVSSDLQKKRVIIGYLRRAMFLIYILVMNMMASFTMDPCTSFSSIASFSRSFDVSSSPTPDSFVFQPSLLVSFAILGFPL